MASRKQITIIHVLKSKLDIDDESYREMLASFNVTSSKLLTSTKATEFIQMLVKQVDQSLGFTGDQLPYDNLGERPGFASPKQLRMLAAMWSEVSRQPTAEQKRNAFRKFLQNRFGVSHEAWLQKHLVERVKRALDAMKGDA